MKKTKFLLNVQNSGLKETDGFYEVRFFGTKNFTFCFLRHEKHFTNPVSGVAILHPNEKEKRDEFTGCKISLVRAVQSFLNNNLNPSDKVVLRLRGKDQSEFRGHLTTLLINAWNDKLNWKVSEQLQQWVDLWTDEGWEENDD